MGSMDEKLSGSILPNLAHLPCTGIDGDLNKLKLTTLLAELPALGLFALGANPSDRTVCCAGGYLWKLKPKDLKFVSTLAEGIEIPYERAWKPHYDDEH